LLLALSALRAEGLTSHVITPSSLAAGIYSTYDDDHYCYYEPAVTQRQRLLVWLPGTEGTPFDYRIITASAAGYGLHAIGLGYVNTNGVNGCSASADCNCFGDARTEMLEGTDTSTRVIVDRINCITSRLTTLLRYLGTNYPAEGWTNYLNAGGSPAWTNIIIGGHSQGGGHAAFIAHKYTVYRCLFFNAADPCLVGTDRPANWVTNSASATPAERYFGFYHLSDELLNHDTQVLMWQGLGITNFAPETLVDSVAPPYDATHTLLTDLTPSTTGSISHHNATAVDYYTPLTNLVPLYSAAWKFMMVGPTVIPDLALERSATSVTFRWESRDDILYRLGRTADLGAGWTNWTAAVEGNGSVQETSAVPAAVQEFHRLQLYY
jgi:hypothetical protein